MTSPVHNVPLPPGHSLPSSSMKDNRTVFRRRVQIRPVGKSDDKAFAPAYAEGRDVGKHSHHHAAEIHVMGGEPTPAVFLNLVAKTPGCLG